MARVAADLMPGRSGNDFTAEFKGRHNAVALERATEITVYSNAAGNIEVSVDAEGTAWEDTTEDAVDGVYTMTKVPVCRGIRVAGVAAASPAPVHIVVRHGI